MNAAALISGFREHQSWRRFVFSLLDGHSDSSLAIFWTHLSGSSAPRPLGGAPKDAVIELQNAHPRGGVFLQAEEAHRLGIQRHHVADRARHFLKEGSQEVALGELGALVLVFEPAAIFEKVASQPYCQRPLPLATRK